MEKKTLKKGVFITFEGPEGCGKSTHSARLFEYLKAEGYPCILTREPGGTKIGEKVREILLNPENDFISMRTELMLFETARSQIVDEVIRPAVSEKKVVLCDRYSDSTVVYQGYAGKLAIKDIYAVDKIATGGLKPDLTVLLDLKPEIGLARAGAIKTKDRMESRSIEYHRMVRNGYLDLSKKFKKRFRVIRVSDDIENTFGMVKKCVASYLAKSTL